MPVGHHDDSTRDGSLVDHVGVDCIRTRKTPNANIRVAHQAARAAQIANTSLREGRLVRWNNAAGRIES
jgi:hypothetical protein